MHGCPFCKPRSCCGPNHKHFVLDTESLQGVCVRHTDDCTALCMPRDFDQNKEVTRVCTKGCNQVFKQNGRMYVCELEKRVSCSPMKTSGQGHQARCKVESWGNTTVSCKYTEDIWQAGGTCASRHVMNQKGKEQIPISSYCKAALKTTDCSLPLAHEQKICTILLQSY